MDDRIIQLLDKTWDHIEFLFAGGGQPGNWRQEPYRSDFFEVFVQMQQIASMDGDQVARLLRERHLRSDDPECEQKSEIVNEIRDAWNEWEYAWTKLRKAR